MNENEIIQTGHSVDENYTMIGEMATNIESMKNDIDSTINEFYNQVNEINKRKPDEIKPLTKTGRKLFEISNLKFTPAAKDKLAFDIMYQAQVKLYLTFGVSAIITILIAIAQLFLS